MNLALKAPPFYNGFTYFCPGCHTFFSVGSEYPEKKITRCPHCGGSDLIGSHQRLAERCRAESADPVRYWPAFPPDGPLPGSRCKATPREIGLVYNTGLDGDTDWNTLPGFINAVHTKTGVPEETIQRLLESGAIDYKECIGAPGISDNHS
jgi:DNA-directed RNA polymerase subunit RPC12/RpoP